MDKMGDTSKLYLGLNINSISGMGDQFRLKNADGEKILKKAINTGEKPNDLKYMREFLDEIKSIHSKLKSITYYEIMGLNVF